MHIKMHYKHTRLTQLSCVIGNLSYININYTSITLVDLHCSLTSA